MNAVQIRLAMDFEMDIPRSSRFYFSEYNVAVNNAIQQFIDSKMGDDSNRNPQNFQWNQGIRDDLYTLIKTATPSVTNGSVVTTQYGSFIPSTIPIPTDYYDFVSLSTLVSSVSSFARPTTYNEIGPLLQDTFKMPTNSCVYYIEGATTWTLWRGATGTIAATVTYIKTPAVFTIGQESNLISPGGAVLTNGVSYIATEDSVQNAVSYTPGTQFTAVGTSLTSGQVIPFLSTLTTDLPERVHADIAKLAASIMQKNIQMYQSAEAIESQVSKT